MTEVHPANSASPPDSTVIPMEHRWELASERQPDARDAMLCLKKVEFDETKRLIAIHFYSAVRNGVAAGLDFILRACRSGPDRLTLTWMDGTGEPINRLHFSACRPVCHRSVADYAKTRSHTQVLVLKYRELTQSAPENAGPHPEHAGKDAMTEPENDQEWCRRTGLYTEAVRRYRISAHWVQKARGTADYQKRLDGFFRSLAVDLDHDCKDVKEQAELLLSYPVLVDKELVKA